MRARESRENATQPVTRNVQDYGDLTKFTLWHSIYFAIGFITGQIHKRCKEDKSELITLMSFASWARLASGEKPQGTDAVIHLSLRAPNMFQHSQHLPRSSWFCSSLFYCDGKIFHFHLNVQKFHSWSVVFFHFCSGPTPTPFGRAGPRFLPPFHYWSSTSSQHAKIFLQNFSQKSMKKSDRSKWLDLVEKYCCAWVVIPGLPNIGSRANTYN